MAQFNLTPGFEKPSRTDVQNATLILARAGVLNPADDTAEYSGSLIDFAAAVRGGEAAEEVSRQRKVKTNATRVAKGTDAASRAAAREAAKAGGPVA